MADGKFCLSQMFGSFNNESSFGKVLEVNILTARRIPGCSLFIPDFNVSFQCISLYILHSELSIIVIRKEQEEGINMPSMMG